MRPSSTRTRISRPTAAAAPQQRFTEPRSRGPALLAAEERPKCVLDVADQVVLLELGRIPVGRSPLRTSSRSSSPRSTLGVRSRRSPRPLREPFWEREMRNMGKLEGKVAFITGAARGQGRSHAIKLAAEGADIIAVDICETFDSMSYPLATPEDLAQTVKGGEELDRRIVARRGDVRVKSELKAVLDAGLAEFGRLDIVVANAGVTAMKSPTTVQAFVDWVDVDLGGVMNTVGVAMPHLSEGASNIVTGSTAGMMKGLVDSPAAGPGGAGYAWAKRTIASYVEVLGLQLAPHMIRINAIHPTNTNTDLLHNEDIYRAFRP